MFSLSAHGVLWLELVHFSPRWTKQKTELIKVVASETIKNNTLSALNLPRVVIPWKNVWQIFVYKVFIFDLKIIPLGKKKCFNEGVGGGGGVIKRQQKTFEYIQPDFLYLFVVLSLDINDSVEEKNTRVQRQRINTLYLCLSAFSKIHPIPPINLTCQEFMLPDAINCFVYCNPLPTFLTPGFDQVKKSSLSKE